MVIEGLDQHEIVAHFIGCGISVRLEISGLVFQAFTVVSFVGFAHDLTHGGRIIIALYCT